MNRLPRPWRAGRTSGPGHSVVFMNGEKGLTGCGKRPVPCHPEQSEGSALFAFNKIQQMLRCAQHDRFPFFRSLLEVTTFRFQPARVFERDDVLSLDF